MPTLVGLAFFLASAYLFRKGSSHLFGLLVFSSIFQAATIFTSGSSYGIQPYFLVAFFFLARCALEIMFGKPRMQRFRGAVTFLGFVFLGVVSSFLYPVLFRGTPVIAPSDYGLGFTVVPLQFSIGNLIQAGLLVVNGLVVIAAGFLPGRVEHAASGLTKAFYFLLCVVMIQFVCLVLHIQFPFSILNNNQHYALANAGEGYTRPNGTFTEPSGAGLMMSGISLAFLARYISTGKSGFNSSLAFVGLILVASSASFLATAMGIGLILVRYPIFRFPAYVRLARLKRLGLLISLSVLILIGLAIPQVRLNILQSTLEKSDSFSLAVRLGQDFAGLEATKDTYGFGVGIGSNRPASLLVSLLSTVGILGLILFLACVRQFQKNDLGEYAWLKWFLGGVILAMAAGTPDTSLPLLWTSFALVARSAQFQRRKEGQELYFPQSSQGSVSLL